MTCKNKSFMTKRKAFTLIELLIVIAIIGILFIVLISKVDFASDKAKATGVQTDFRSFQMAFETVAREQSGFSKLVDDNYDKLEVAINKNLDNKLKIDIDDMGNITMANGATDPWNTAYHGQYVSGNDGKDRGAIIMYSNGANMHFGSEISITGGVASINTVTDAGMDDYSMVVIYSLNNGAGEVKTTTSGFSSNQVDKQPNINNTEQPVGPDDICSEDYSEYYGLYLLDYRTAFESLIESEDPANLALASWGLNITETGNYDAQILDFAMEFKDDKIFIHLGIYWKDYNTFVSYDCYEDNPDVCIHEFLNKENNVFGYDFVSFNGNEMKLLEDGTPLSFQKRDVTLIDATTVTEFTPVRGTVGFHGGSRYGIVENCYIYNTTNSSIVRNNDGTYNISLDFAEIEYAVTNPSALQFAGIYPSGTITTESWNSSNAMFIELYMMYDFDAINAALSVPGGYEDFEVVLFIPTECLN